MLGWDYCLAVLSFVFSVTFIGYQIQSVYFHGVPSFLVELYCTNSFIYLLGNFLSRKEIGPRRNENLIHVFDKRSWKEKQKWVMGKRWLVPTWRNCEFKCGHASSQKKPFWRNPRAPGADGKLVYSAAENELKKDCALESLSCSIFPNVAVA